MQSHNLTFHKVIDDNGRPSMDAMQKSINHFLNTFIMNGSFTPFEIPLGSTFARPIPDGETPEADTPSSPGQDKAIMLRVWASVNIEVEAIHGPGNKDARTPIVFPLEYTGKGKPTSQQVQENFNWPDFLKDPVVHRVDLISMQGLKP
jgi:hypothetical protein